MERKKTTKRPTVSRKAQREAPLRTLTLSEVMTPMPLTLDEDRSIRTARTLFREMNIRHLPIVHQGRLTGILSERDARVVGLLPDLEKIAVAEIMTRKPLCLRESTKVSHAIKRMLEKKCGSIIVKDSKDRIAGIFTTDDALELFVGQRP